jgi:hypothetical protein
VTKKVVGVFVRFRAPLQNDDDFSPPCENLNFFTMRIYVISGSQISIIGVSNSHTENVSIIISQINLSVV